MLLVIFCLIRPIYSLFAKADFPDVTQRAHLGKNHGEAGVDDVH